MPLKFSVISRVSRVKSIIIFALFSGLTAFAGAAEFYYTNRTFTAVEFGPQINRPADILNTESKKLTDIVRGTNISINMTNTYAIEKQAAIPISYGSALAAWNAALAYTGTSMNYLGKTFDNVGWVRGTKNTAGGWGAYLWILQNRIAFQASTTAWWTATNDISVAITNVMVGSLGDYQPLEKVDTNVPPLSMATNDFPGADRSDEATYQVDYTNVFYKVVIPDIWITPRFAVRCVGGSNVQYTVTGTNIPKGVTWSIFQTNFVGHAVLQTNINWHLAEVTPGSVATNYKVRATSKDNTNFYDEVDLTVVKVESIDATSPKAGTSLNPPPFEGHKSWPFVVTNSPNPDKHMVVFYKDVIDSSFNVQDFDITLKANLLLSSVSADQLNEVWSKISGPNSGNLNRTDTFEIKYQNPKQGGVYRFDFDLGCSSLAKSEANVVLPLAGAEIDSIVQADIGRADTFATKVIANYSLFERNFHIFRWFYVGGSGDYLGRPNSVPTPTVWAYNQLNTTEESETWGIGVVVTWTNIPVRLTKTSNFMVGYGMKKIGISREVAWLAQLAGTPNDLAAEKSWNAGWNIAAGSNYNSTVSAMVKDIFDDHDDPNQKNMKLWPNSNAAENYVVPDIFWDPDHQFTSPGFLYLTNP